MKVREIAVNAAIGFLLLAILAIVFALGIGAFELSLHAMHLGARRFLPGLARWPQAELYGLFGVGSLISAIRYFQKRLWRNAFISLVAVAITPSICFAGSNAPFGLGSTAGILPFLIVFAIASDSDLSRSRFLVAASLAGIIAAVDTGLLGNGSFARIVGDCLLAAALTWLVMRARQNWGRSKNPDPRSPLAQAGT